MRQKKRFQSVQKKNISFHVLRIQAHLNSHSFSVIIGRRKTHHRDQINKGNTNKCR